MVRCREAGWTSPEIVGWLGAGLVLSMTFIWWESRTPAELGRPAGHGSSHDIGDLLPLAGRQLRHRALRDRAGQPSRLTAGRASAPGCAQGNRPGAADRFSSGHAALPLRKFAETPQRMGTGLPQGSGSLSVLCPPQRQPLIALT